MQIPLLKHCKRCGQTKFITEFYNNKNLKDGHGFYCKRCLAADPEYFDKKQAGLKHCPSCSQWLDKQAFNKSKNEGDGLTNVCRKCANEYTRKHHQSEQGKANRKAYLDSVKHTEHYKHLIVQAAHRRRERVSKTESTLTLAEWHSILESQGYKCAICKRNFSDNLKPERDHIKPVSKGGGLTRDNVQALCKPCNSRKKDKEI